MNPKSTHTFLKSLFLFALSFSIGIFTSPPIIPSPFPLWIKNVCTNYLYQWGIKGALEIFKTTLLGQLYKLSLFLSCLPLRWFGNDPVPHKIIASSFFGVFSLTLFLFLKKLTKDEKLSLISSIFTILLPPFVFYSWPVLDYANIAGAWLVILTSILFLTEKRGYIFHILTFIIAFLSSFLTEQSRLYTLPVLLIMFFIYKEKRKKNLPLLFMNAFFTILSIMLHMKYAERYGPGLKGIKGLSMSIIYYTHFIFCYFIYLFGFTGVLLFLTSFIRFFQKIALPFLIFFLTGLILTFSIPLYPYAELGFNFFFITNGPPYGFFLCAIFIISLSIFTLLKNGEIWEKFSITSIFICSSILIFITGIYPRIRTDPSARHLMAILPLFSLILFKNLFDLMNDKRLRFLSVLLISGLFLRNFFLILSLISMGRGISHLGYELHYFFTKEEKVARDGLCIFYLNPQYYIIDMRDIVSNPYKSRVFMVNEDLEAMEFIRKNYCEGKKVFGIVWRFRPLHAPVFKSAGDSFFTYMRSFSDTGDDQFNIAGFSRMHTTDDISIEKDMRGKKIVFKAEGSYIVPPLFLKEFIHRLINGIPVFLRYRYYFNVYEL